jgi:uncharacterized protein
VRHVVIAGVSTRAAAESAARAGFEVTAIDAFADLDQHPSVRAMLVPRPFTAHAAARAARNLPCDAVAYLSTFENHPDAVGVLVANRDLWGNTPAVLRRVRDPMRLMNALRRRGWAVPAVRLASTLSNPPEGNAHGHGDTGWLVKPFASGGGHAVRPWHQDARVPSDCYLQELIPGVPGSVLFVAADGRAVPFGVSRQLVGEAAFGAAGYRYCGNILAPGGPGGPGDDVALVDAACRLAREVAEEFGLVGVNGIDFIAREASPYAVEVNPRWTASMELVERGYGLSVFEAHVAACTGGALPEFDVLRARRVAAAVGKAVVFARGDVVIGDTSTWLGGGSIRDVPRAGEQIRAGRPVCTVFAAGRDDAACHAALVRRADQVYAQLAAWKVADACPGQDRRQ